MTSPKVPLRASAVHAAGLLSNTSTSSRLLVPYSPDTKRGPYPIAPTHLLAVAKPVQRITACPRPTSPGYCRLPFSLCEVVIVPLMQCKMTGTKESTMQFKDAGDYVQVDLPDLSTDGKASFTGDSVHIKSADHSGRFLFEVAQLYSTIDAEHSRMEILPKGVRLHLKKLTPGEAWPQLTAAADAASELEKGPANALQERQAVEVMRLGIISASICQLNTPCTLFSMMHAMKFCWFDIVEVALKDWTSH